MHSCGIKHVLYAILCCSSEQYSNYLNMLEQELTNVSYQGKKYRNYTEGKKKILLQVLLNGHSPALCTCMYLNYTTVQCTNWLIAIKYIACYDKIELESLQVRH